jgi:putative zinc finger/helix-turn-helix YgiT family protein
MEDSAMKCWECGAAMETSQETISYDCGVEGIVLEGVKVHRCPECGESGTTIPRMEALHREIAHTLARRPAKLGPREIRFLRKWLGLSGQDFAEFFHVDKSTVSRWERTDQPKPMGAQTEILLRVLVLTGQPLENYAPGEPTPDGLHFAPSSRGWKRRAA